MRPIAKLLKRSDRTLVLWHGGNLDALQDFQEEAKKGRQEYGPGLYLTTHYDTALKYTKGSRKLYRVTVAAGNDARETLLPVEAVVGFVEQHVIRSKQQGVLAMVERRKDKFFADYLINSIVNNEAMPTSRYHLLQRFLVEQGVDYLLVPNAFGWHETMLVLLNMKKIVKTEVITSKTQIGVFNLPTEFDEK